MSLDPRQCLAAARELVDRADHDTEGLWARTAAYFARAALEHAVHGRWQGDRDPRRVGFDVQLLCLREQDPELARTASFVWNALSEACHLNGYSLPPTAGELRRWLGEVEEMVEGGTR